MRSYGWIFEQQLFLIVGAHLKCNQFRISYKRMSHRWYVLWQKCRSRKSFRFPFVTLFCDNNHTTQHNATQKLTQRAQYTQTLMIPSNKIGALNYRLWRAGPFVEWIIRYHERKKLLITIRERWLILQIKTPHNRLKHSMWLGGWFAWKSISDFRSRPKKTLIKEIANKATFTAGQLYLSSIIRSFDFMDGMCDVSEQNAHNEFF